MSTSHRIVWAVLAASILSLPVPTLSAGAGGRELVARAPHAKPTRSRISESEKPHALVVKFQEGLAVVLEDGRFVSNDRRVEQANSIVAAYGYAARPSFRQSRERLRQLQTIAQRDGTHETADLSLYFDLLTPTRGDVPQAEALLDSLNHLEVVEVAYAEPIIALPSPDTPNFAPIQSYTHAAPVGVDTKWANGQPGGTGGFVWFYDIEGSAIFDHEDLQLPDGTLISGVLAPEPRPKNHGTAVWGIIRGLDNGFGVTGMVPRVVPRMASYCREVDLDPSGQPECSSKSPMAAILDAIDDVDGLLGTLPTTVFLLEMQTASWKPIELAPGVFDAIRTATNMGIAVVEAAGNGGWDLDEITDSSGTPFFERDSGAIMVGAGCPPSWVAPDYCQEPREALVAEQGASNYGARVDVQGWGAAVTTTGWWGGAFNEGETRTYTRSFGGTSAASAIVAGAVASIQGMVNWQYSQPGIYPEALRTILRETGTSQPYPNAFFRRIGPLPDVRKAWERIEEDWDELKIVGIGIDDAEAPEGDKLHFRVALTAPATHVVRVEWVAVYDKEASPDDVTPSGSNANLPILGEVEIAPGDVEAIIEIQTVQDGVLEGDERISVVIESASGAKIKDDRATGTILDDEHQVYEGKFTRGG